MRRNRAAVRRSRRWWAWGCRVSCVSSLVLGLVIPGASAQEMPDPSQIHGLAIPASELPAGTVTVRVVREALGNNIEGQQVRVTVGTETRTAVTDDLGRAEFSDLPRGAEVRAETTVDGEALVSRPFQVPATGGLRIILVAGLAEAAARRARDREEAAVAPPVQGMVVLGGSSRVLLQFEEEALQVYYDLEIVNNARSRVDIGGPLVIDLPRAASNTTILGGSSPSASASGNRITITGPFAAGSTPVQIAYRLRYDSREFTFDQTWPAGLQQVTVGVQRLGDLIVSSPQFSTTNEVRGNDGTTWVLSSGPALPPGATLSLTLSNVPVHSRTPRFVALALAVAIGGLGTWLAVTARSSSGKVRETLIARRERLMGDLVRLEVRRRAGELPARDAARRQRILAELEQVYGELDDSYAGPHESGTGVAA